MGLFCGLSVFEPEHLKSLGADYKDRFKMLKITPEVLESREWQLFAAGSKLDGVELTLDRAAERTLCAMAPETGIKMRIDFIRRFAAICRRAAENQCRAVSAGFDFDRMLTDEAYRLKLLTLLRSLTGLLDELNIDLLLKTRLPSLAGESATGMAGRVMQELPGGRFKLLPELHPHEPAFALLTGEALRPVRFHLSALEAVYEPATGNRMTSKHLQRHTECMKAFGRPAKIFISPAGADADTLSAEMVNLENLQESLKDSLFQK